MGKTWLVKTNTLIVNSTSVFFCISFIVYWHKKSLDFHFRFSAQSFPTPMEEPKKVLKAQYLGSTEVNQPTGMDVLNTAIETALHDTKPEQWENVNVAVAPSMISINSSEVLFYPRVCWRSFVISILIAFRFIWSMQDDRLIAECRVRYLSFLGIGKNVKNCAFIMHTAQDKFICHVFLCEPSSGALCKTIEAACKVMKKTATNWLYLASFSDCWKINFRLIILIIFLLPVTLPKMLRCTSRKSAINRFKYTK